ncbi:esterase-like activity of phytase family protein [Legionella sp. km535]|uniref:esterase-like activity of phytase family protein n=1 Tax=Legionella sp. km535 TaxID=2498107 RepID=UPI000F8D2D7B|nr:esterase-like activity of phytase family protein [Legionella sp. km535]RUR19313.1 esterase-like activity of phytase family protein [Legionella sp. km535]
MKFLLILLLLASCSIPDKEQPNATFIELPQFMGNSGLVLESNQGNDFTFWSLTDRGPNATEFLSSKNEIMRPFLNPAFHPYWTQFSVNLKSKKVKVLKNISTSVTGLPNQKGDEVPVNAQGTVLKFDPNGMDPESMCKTSTIVWIGEEYRPSIAKFTTEGILLKRYSPGKGLPEIFAQRKLNRGFEGLSCYGDKVYAILQSPLSNEKKLVRLVEFDPATEQVTREFLYPLDAPEADKIGDLSVTRDGTFYVIEQNSLTGPNSFHKIFSFKLGNARLLQKKLELDLTKSGFGFADKLEGLVVTDDYFFVVNDNDFGLTNDKFDPNRKSYLGVFPR